MKPVKQTIFGFKNGDCFRACVASIFELNIKTVPNFMQNGPDHFFSYLETWCDQNGIKAIDITIENQNQSIINGCYIIAAGKSPRTTSGNQQHCVVWFNGKMIFDPHPTNKGISGDPEMYTIFINKDPSKILKKEL